MQGEEGNRQWSMKFQINHVTTYLAPEQAGVGVSVEVRCNEVVREGRELLETTDGDVLDTPVLASL